MTLWIALLRGINIGGNHKLSMKDLTALLHDLGASQVKTYIQSGNVVLHHPSPDRQTLAQAITTAIAEAHGFAPHVLLLTHAELTRAMDANPFPGGVLDPKSLHLFFMDAPPPNPDLAGLEGVRIGSEQFALLGATFYLLAPEGIGRSRLAAKVERALGMAATARNWNTCQKMRDLVDHLA